MFQLRRDVAARRRRLLWVSAVLAAWFIGQHSAWAAKNVILMVADGAGHNTWLATSMFQGKVGQQVYDQPGWQRFSCCTYPLNSSGKPTGDDKQDPAIIYNPRNAWDTAPSGEKPGEFACYQYLTTTCTDSAAAATALSTGRKAYNGSINWSNADRPIRGETIAEIAKALGKSVGVATSVPWSHATPAALSGAHNISRNNLVEIANEMLDADWLDVIMGAGNPDFDEDGRPMAAEKKRNYKYVGGQETWQAIKSGRREWKLIESKADFEALANGPTPPKVLGMAQVATTLQQNRGRGAAAITPYDKRTADQSSQRQAPLPFATPLNENVPSLATMARAAINCLDDNPNGFFLMVEGGAVDWANHANEPDRMIEEQIDFVAAVEAVVAWIESHGGWDDTLLILTADHETGLIWGDCPNFRGHRGAAVVGENETVPVDSKNVPFEPLADRGPGKLPAMTYHSHGHGNCLVPLYARGPGSMNFADLAKGKDETAAARWQFSGLFVENTDVFRVMRAEIDNADSGKRTPDSDRR